MKTKVKFFARRLGVFSYRLLILAGVVYFGYILFRQIHANYEINLQIDRLEKEIQALKIKNQNLANLLVYYQSHTYRQMEAKKRLGLKSPGEKVLIMPENKDILAFNQSAKELNRLAKNKQSDKPNYLKWYGLIFGQKSFTHLP